MPTFMPPDKLAGWVAMHLPNLLRVRLMMEEFRPALGTFVPDFVQRSLKEFDIGFPTGERFPREDCWEILGRLTKVCPALEVVRFGALFPVEGGGIDERNIPLD